MSPQSRPRIGLALGSGAARGWAHIGIFEALDTLGIVPDVVCGTSIGALVGAAFVTGKLSALKTRITENFGWREIVGLLDVRLATGGLIEGRRIESFLESLHITGAIEDQKIRFGAVATDLASGREVWLLKGAIGRAVRASIGMPGIFSPTPDEETGGWLLDGGLVNPVPVSLARALGADIVIGVDLSADLLGRRFSDEADAEAPAKGPSQLLNSLRESLSSGFARALEARPTFPSYFEVLANSLNIMQDRVTRARLAGEPPHVLLTPHLRNFDWLDFDRARDAIDEGLACVARSEAAFRHYFAKWMPRKPGPQSEATTPA